LSLISALKVPSEQGWHFLLTIS
jgi:hypothetical protein